MTWKLALAVFLGGACGSLCRYSMASFLPFQVNAFAWATFGVNMLGCLLIGILFPVLESEIWKALLLVGLLGGFTTFSGFGLEVLRYLNHGNFQLGMVYGISSLILGTVLVWIGSKITLSFI